MLAGTLWRWTGRVDGYADPFGVSISRPSINLGKANNMPQGWDSVRYQVVDTLAHTIGRHELKAGIDLQFDDQNTYFLGNKDGTFTFRTDAPFNPDDGPRIPSSTRRPSATGTTIARTRSTRPSCRTAGAPPTD